MNPDWLPEGCESAELLGIYLESGRESLQSIAQALRSLQESASSEVDLALVLRKSHNLKGASRQFGFAEPGLVAEAMENLAAHLLDRGRQPDQDDCKALSLGTTCLEDCLQAIELGRSTPEVARVCTRLEARLGEAG